MHSLITSAPILSKKAVVRTLESSSEHEWDQYVERTEAATVFHTIAWKKSVERAFGFKSCYLLAEREGHVSGILPLFRVANPIIGKALISTPFAVYGGICADDLESADALKSHACELAESQGVKYLELRARSMAPELTRGFHQKNLYFSFDRELPPDPDTLMKSFPRDTRYMIRKAQKTGLVSEIDNDAIGTLHHIYAISVRNLGTPVFSKNWFAILKEEFGTAFEILVVKGPSGALACVQSFKFKDWIIPFYGGASLEARKFAANNFMYWEVMRRALEERIKRYDFGRSKLDTGAFFFKTQWAMEQHALPYQFFLVRQKSLPNYSPANSRFHFAIEAWKRVPVPVTKIVGPVLVKLFP